jgi:hypothetical protein
VEEQAAPEKKKDGEIVEASEVAAALEEYADHKEKEDIQEKAYKENASKGDELVLNSDEDGKHKNKTEVPVTIAHGQVGLSLSPPKMQSNRVSQ